MRIHRTDPRQNPLPDISVKLETIRGNLHISSNSETWILTLDDFMQMVEAYLGGSSCQG